SDCSASVYASRPEPGCRPSLAINEHASLPALFRHRAAPPLRESACDEPGRDRARPAHGKFLDAARATDRQSNRVAKELKDSLRLPPAPSENRDQLRYTSPDPAPSDP